MPDDDEPAEDAADLPGSVGDPTTALPSGYAYGVTRYADIVLQRAFPEHFEDLVAVLDGFEIGLDELQAGGGSKTELARRFDDALMERGWGRSATWSRSSFANKRESPTCGSPCRRARSTGRRSRGSFGR